MYPIPPDSQALFGKRREEEQERNREKKQQQDRSQGTRNSRMQLLCLVHVVKGIVKSLILIIDVSFSNLYSIYSSYTVMQKNGEVKIYDTHIFLLHSKNNDLLKTFC